MEDIRNLMQVVTRRFGLLNRNCCQTDDKEVTISLVQSHILYEINRNPSPSMQQVAETLGMDLTTFSRQIQSLVKGGLVKKTPYPEDRRIHLLSLTNEGQQLAETIDKNVKANLEEVFSKLSDFEQKMVIESFKLLSNAMSESNSCCHIL